jgi:hypothetical protein
MVNPPVLPIRSYSLKRQVVRGSESGEAGEIEKEKALEKAPKGLTSPPSRSELEKGELTKAASPMNPPTNVELTPDDPLPENARSPPLY